MTRFGSFLNVFDLYFAFGFWLDWDVEGYRMERHMSFHILVDYCLARGFVVRLVCFWIRFDFRFDLSWSLLALMLNAAVFCLEESWKGNWTSWFYSQYQQTSGIWIGLLWQKAGRFIPLPSQGGGAFGLFRHLNCFGIDQKVWRLIHLSSHSRVGFLVFDCEMKRNTWSNAVEGLLGLNHQCIDIRATTVWGKVLRLLLFPAFATHLYYFCFVRCSLGWTLGVWWWVAALEALVLPKSQ